LSVSKNILKTLINDLTRFKIIIGNFNHST
jgi:hypothetical protein